MSAYSIGLRMVKSCTPRHMNGGDDIHIRHGVPGRDERRAIEVLCVKAVGVFLGQVRAGARKGADEGLRGVVVVEAVLVAVRVLRRGAGEVAQDRHVVCEVVVDEEVVHIGPKK